MDVESRLIAAQLQSARAHVRNRAQLLGVKGSVTDVPSINADLDKCGVLSGGPRINCYAALDKKLTTQIVPWVPYLWSYAQSVSSTNVTKFVFDQFGGTIAYAHVAVKS